MGSSRAADLRDAALLGAAAGLRTAAPLAVLALRGRLGGRRMRVAFLAGAAFELAGDKHPKALPRTSPAGLGPRLATATVAGARVAGPPGLPVAAAAAVAAAYAGQHVRRLVGERSGAPDPAVAVGEDVLAYAVAAAGARRRRPWWPRVLDG